MDMRLKLECIFLLYKSCFAEFGFSSFRAKISW
jgi:hypothetical protein